MSGIHPAGLRTLLAVPHLRILPLPSFLTVQVPLSFLLLSLMPAMKSKRQRQQQGARRDGTPRKNGLLIISRELQHSAPAVPWHCPHQSPGTAEEAATPQAIRQCWEHTVFILHSPEFVSMDCWLAVPSRRRSRKETLLPGFHVHLEGDDCAPPCCGHMEGCLSSTPSSPFPSSGTGMELFLCLWMGQVGICPILNGVPGTPVW